MAAHVLYLIFKKESNEDRCFIPPNQVNLTAMLEKLAFLGSARHCKYDKERQLIEDYWNKTKLNESKLNRKYRRVTEYIQYLFFDRFEKKWEAFRKADWGMRFIFLLSLVYGWFYLFVMLLYVFGDQEVALDQNNIRQAVMGTIVLFIVPLIFGLVFLWFTQP